MNNPTLINHPNSESIALLINQIHQKPDKMQYYIEKEFITLQVFKKEQCFFNNLPNIQKVSKQFPMMLLFFQKSQY